MPNTPSAWATEEEHGFSRASGSDRMPALAAEINDAEYPSACATEEEHGFSRASGSDKMPALAAEKREPRAILFYEITSQQSALINALRGFLVKTAREMCNILHTGFRLPVSSAGSNTG